MQSVVFQPASAWPVAAECDLLVAGAGPSGLAAAVAAARLGVSTVLVERHGFAGGVATAGCCPHLMGFAAGGRQIVGGVADELVRELDRMGAASFRINPHSVPERLPIGDRPLLGDVETSIEAVRVAANRLLDRAGVRRLFYTGVIGATVQDGRVSAVAVDRREGPALVRARTVVDATGDAHLVHLAGGAVREAPLDDAMTKTILIRVGGVPAFDRVPMTEVFNRLVAAGKVPLAAQDAFMCYAMLNPGEVQLNFTLTRGDGLISAALTQMDAELREQALLAVDWFRREIPGFGDCYLVDAAVSVGVRAGRSMVGLETITQRDVDENSPVLEPIALGTRGYGGHGVRRFRSDWGKSQPGLRGIPWRALLSASFPNVAAGGRAISAEPRVIDTFRLMARCLAIGQAAGVTAALAARQGGDLVQVGYDAVRRELLRQHAILE